jgi:glycosyltransferase involved in cell wall biosynthesis
MQTANSNRTSIALMISQLMTYGGTERVTSILSKELSKYYNCSIITQYQEGSSVYTIDENVKWFNVNSHKIRLRYCFFSLASKIANFLRENHINILIIVGRNNSWIPFAVKILYPKVHIIFCEHNSLAMNRYNSSLHKKISTQLYQWLINKLSSEIVVLTKKELELYKKENPSIEKKVSFIYNIADDSLFQNKVQYNINSKKIISVGRLDFQKGYDKMIKLAAPVLHRHQDWEWHIYGSGTTSYVNFLKEQVRLNGIEKQFVFKGVSQNLYSKYTDYGIYAMTSRWEGLPMVLLEAQSNNLPIISFDLYSGPSEVIRNGVNGYLIEPDNIDSFRQKLELLINHPEIRQQMASHARDNMKKFKTTEVMMHWRKLIDRYR